MKTWITLENVLFSFGDSNIRQKPSQQHNSSQGYQCMPTAHCWMCIYRTLTRQAMLLCHAVHCFLSAVWTTPETCLHLHHLGMVYDTKYYYSSFNSVCLSRETMKTSLVWCVHSCVCSSRAELVNVPPVGSLSHFLFPREVKAIRELMKPC